MVYFMSRSALAILLIENQVRYRQVSATERYPLEKGVRYRKVSATEKCPLQKGVHYRRSAVDIGFPLQLVLTVVTEVLIMYYLTV